MTAIVFSGRALRMALLCAVIVGTAALGAVAGSREHSQQPSASTPTAAVAFGFLPDPDFGPGYDTDGSIPQVYGIAGLAAVNTALKQAVLTEEVQARQSFAGLYPSSGPNQPYKGRFGTYPQEGILYADRHIVSVLIPVDAIPPGGNDGGSWVAETALVPSGKSVQISDLFARPAAALRALQRLVGDDVVVSAPCVVQDLTEFDGAMSTVESRLVPTPSTFAVFALTPYGLTFGFPQGTFSAEACGTTTATVAWTSLTSMLSSLGAEIEKDVAS